MKRAEIERKTPIQSFVSNSTGRESGNGGQVVKQVGRWIESRIKARFHDLHYPYASIEEDGTLVRYLEMKGKTYPIVYLDTPLEEGRTFEFNIINGPPRASQPELVTIFGLTECEIDEWDNECHVGKCCGEGAFCEGQNIKLAVYRSENEINITTIEVTVVPGENSLCRLTSIFEDGKIKSTKFLDKESKFQSTSKLYPFFVLGSRAHEIQVRLLEFEKAKPQQSQAIGHLRQCFKR